MRMEDKKIEYKYCLRCGRRLKSAEAKRVGMGKVCAEKVSKYRTYKLF